MNTRHNALLFLIFILLTIISACADRNFDNTQYEKATVIKTFKLGNDKESLHIKTSEGINAIMTLVSSGSVLIKFQDEKNERMVCNTNWIFTAEIRQLREKDLLFVKIAGSRLTSLNEWENEVKIFKYDLSTRKLIGWVKI